MRVLIGCEFSATVREAFRRRGHDAWSCDFLPSEIPGKHIQGDVIIALMQRWDLAILHPPCTALTVAGNGTYGEGMPKFDERKKAIEWTWRLWKIACHFSKKVAMENPIGVLSRYKKPSQIINPFEFGHLEQKKTCLWLKNLPCLVPTKNVFSEMMKLPKNQRERLHFLPPSPDRWKIRAKTFSGIAEAMADQWGDGRIVTSEEYQVELFAAA